MSGYNINQLDTSITQQSFANAFPAAAQDVEGVAPCPRGGHACVSLDSRVIVFGGSDRAPVTFEDLWVLETNTATFEWTRISPSLAPGCQMSPRSSATLTVIGDKVYMFGGQEPVTEVRFSDIKCLDTNTWTWSNVEAKGGPPPPRHSHCAGAVANQCLLIYGGSGYADTLHDIWLFNTESGDWSCPIVSGEQPPARELHSGSMISPTSMLIFGGRAADGRVLCDAAVFDASAMKWAATEPTPFTRCAHTGVTIPRPGAQANGHAEGSNGTSSTSCVLIYGGFSGEAVSGDMLCIDGQSLDIEQLHRGPRDDDAAGTVPQARFAHGAVCIPWPAASCGQALLVFGGVNPAEDLNDVAVWVQD